MFKQLKTFKCVYESQSFSKASKKMYISQPAVSSQISYLEEKLGGVRLFNRNGRKEITITPSGDLLYQKTLDLLDLWQDTKEQVSALNQENQAHCLCKIGASQTVASTIFPQILPWLQEEFPAVEFEVMVANSEVILEKVENRFLHFGFIEKAMSTTTLSRREVMTDELVLAGDPSSSLWLLREEHSGSFYYANQYLENQNITPDKKVVLASNELIVDYLKKGMGQAIISKRYMTDKIPYTTLNQNYVRNFYLVNRKLFSNDSYLSIHNYLLKILEGLEKGLLEKDTVLENSSTK